MQQMLGLELRKCGEVSTEGRWKEEKKDCMRESGISDMYFLFRPKFWENLLESLFGTLSPPSGNIRGGGEGRDNGGEALGVKAGLRLGVENVYPHLSKRPARFLHLKLLSQRSICLLSFEVLLRKEGGMPCSVAGPGSLLTSRHCGPGNCCSVKLGAHLLGACVLAC